MHASLHAFLYDTSALPYVRSFCVHLVTLTTTSQSSSHRLSIFRSVTYSCYPSSDINNNTLWLTTWWAPISPGDVVLGFFGGLRWSCVFIRGLAKQLVCRQLSAWTWRCDLLVIVIVKNLAWHHVWWKSAYLIMVSYPASPSRLTRIESSCEIHQITEIRRSYILTPSMFLPRCKQLLQLSVVTSDVE